MADKLVPNDSRVKSVTTEIRGKNYKYIISEPEGTPVATMLLIHGFPDMGFGWRYQVPHFTKLGFRVVIPDMVGYAGTDAPESLEEYTLKSVSTDMKELVEKIVPGEQIILGGHDWGGFLVWRLAMWYPELIKGVFSVCTPNIAPSTQYIPLEDLIKAGYLTNFSYQLQFEHPDVHEKLQGEEGVRQLLNALYGGQAAEGESGFDVKSGIIFDRLPHLQHSQLVTEEELNYYVQQYMLREKPELRGPLNWYRTRELNFRDEKPIAEKGGHKFEMPALFITATKDTALPPSMSSGMDAHFADLTRGEVDASHWALWQASEEVNKQITNWADKVLNGALKSSL